MLLRGVATITTDHSSITWDKTNRQRGHEPERGIQKFFLLVLEDGRGVTWRLKGVRSWVGPVWGVRHFPEADVVLSLPQQWPCSRCGTGRFTCSMRG